jgi:hypothetical protein
MYILVKKAALQALKTFNDLDVGREGKPGWLQSVLVFNLTRSVSAVSIVALVPTTLLTVELRFLRLLLRKHFGLAKRFYRQLALRIAERLSSLIVVPKGYSDIAVNPPLRHVRSETPVGLKTVGYEEDKDDRYRKMFNIEEKDEVVFQVYSASLSKKDLLEHECKMYISDHHVCFSTKRVGLTMNKSLLLQSISGVTLRGKTLIEFVYVDGGKKKSAKRRQVHFSNSLDTSG